MTTSAMKRRLAAAARLRRAAAGRPHRDVLDAWLVKAGQVADAALGAAVTTDGETLTFHLDVDEEGPAWLARALAAEGTEPPDLAALTSCVETLRPGRTGWWIAARGEVLDRGWALGGDLPLDRALEIGGATEPARQLAAWAERHGVTRATRISRSLGRGNRYTELWLPLDGVVEASAGEAVLDGYRSLRVLPPPPWVLWAADDRPAVLSVWLTAGGVSKVGLLVARPRTDEVIRASLTAGVPEAAQLRFAEVEGVLGTVERAWMEVRRFAERTDVQVRIDL